jgi:hypothetical protein
MSDHLQAIHIFGRQNGQTHIALDQMAGIDQLTIHFGSQSRLGQSGPDGGGHIGHRDGGSKIADRSIRQENLGHGQLGEVSVYSTKNKRGIGRAKGLIFP